MIHIVTLIGMTVALLVCFSVPIPGQIPVILDTDANNELDDQHAMAYLFFNEAVFDVKGVTVNATYNGGELDQHVLEAQRVMRLCDVYGDVPLLAGAQNGFDKILPTIGDSEYDGQEAVQFIVDQARTTSTVLTLLPIGKLTNIALALAIAPDIQERVRVVWLGSNYPEPGEYNQDNDPAALRYMLEQNVPFEMVMVRYGRPSGTDAVRVTPADITENLLGTGPSVPPIEGRHGGTFTNFGDYSVELFSKINLHGDPPARALFDMVAVAILKNPGWGEAHIIPAPQLVRNVWVDRPHNTRKITIWENFNADLVLDDFYQVMKGHTK